MTHKPNDPIFNAEFWAGVQRRSDRIGNLPLSELPSCDEIAAACDDSVCDDAVFDAEFWAGVQRRARRIGNLPLSELPSSPEVAVEYQIPPPLPAALDWAEFERSLHHYASTMVLLISDELRRLRSTFALAAGTQIENESCSYGAAWSCESQWAVGDSFSLRWRTDEERAIIILVISGCDIDVTAHALHTSLSEVGRHVDALFERLGSDWARTRSVRTAVSSSALTSKPLFGSAIADTLLQTHLLEDQEESLWPTHGHYRDLLDNPPRLTRRTMRVPDERVRDSFFGRALGRAESWCLWTAFTLPAREAATKAESFAIWEPKLLLPGNQIGGRVTPPLDPWSIRRLAAGVRWKSRGEIATERCSAESSGALVDPGRPQEASETCPNQDDDHQVTHILGSSSRSVGSNANRHSFFGGLLPECLNNEITYEPANLRGEPEPCLPRGYRYSWKFRFDRWPDLASMDAATADPMAMTPLSSGGLIPGDGLIPVDQLGSDGAVEEWLVYPGHTRGWDAGSLELGSEYHSRAIGGMDSLSMLPSVKMSVVRGEEDPVASIEMVAHAKDDGMMTVVKGDSLIAFKPGLVSGWACSNIK